MFASSATPSIFDDAAALARLYAPPVDAGDEPRATFPLGFYEHFLQEIVRRGIVVITFGDLFRESDDWDFEGGYPREFRRWQRDMRDPKKVYLLIQHDVDNHPFFTKRMIAMEQVYGVRSSSFIFHERYTRDGAGAPYDIDHVFFGESQRHGFDVGYHQNALQLADFSVERAVDRFRSDLAALKKMYDIRFMVPHGGVGREINGRMHHNLDVPMPAELRATLRWVFNRYGPQFADGWSDGGLGKARDPKRIASFDIVGSFLDKLKPGTRNRVLVHPQRWGYNIDPSLNPMLADAAWYQRMCSTFSAGGSGRT